MFRKGDQIGSYSLLKRLGKGAFGEVWLAEEKTAISAHKFALKFPNEEDIDAEAIRQEADVWEKVKGHPNVLPIIKADIFDGQVYIASEYAPDGSLSEWLKKHEGRAPTTEIAVEMTKGILAGLEHLHSKGVIHRDLKPANILLQADTPRIADFGIARLVKSSTTAGSTLSAGTPSYMSPECFYSVRSEQTDIWAVGVLLHKLLSGKLPFEHPDQVSVMNAILNSPPNIDPDIPEPLRQIIGKALQKDIALRYKTAAEMREDLNKFTSGTDLSDEITLPDAAAAKAAGAADVTTVVSPVSVVALPAEAEEVAGKAAEREEETIVRPKSEKVYVERVVERPPEGGSKAAAVGLGIFLALAAAVTIWAALWYAGGGGGGGDDPASQTGFSNSSNQSTGNSGLVNGRGVPLSNQSSQGVSNQSSAPSTVPMLPGSGGAGSENPSAPTTTTDIPPEDLSTDPVPAPTYDIEPDDPSQNANVRGGRTPRPSPTPDEGDDDEPPPPPPSPARTTPTPTEVEPTPPRPSRNNRATPRPTAAPTQPEGIPPLAGNSNSN